MPGHADSVGPFQDRPAGHLRSIVAHDHGWKPAPGDQPIQLPGHALGADRGVDHQSQGLAREVAAPTSGSSTMHRMRKRRPQDRLSATKSRLQLWLGPFGRAMGARVRVARLRPRRRRTARPSSR